MSAKLKLPATKDEWAALIRKANSESKTGGVLASELGIPYSRLLSLSRECGVTLRHMNSDSIDFRESRTRPKKETKNDANRYEAGRNALKVWIARKGFTAAEASDALEITGACLHGWLRCGRRPGSLESTAKVERLTGGAVKMDVWMDKEARKDLLAFRG